MYFLDPFLRFYSWLIFIGVVIVGYVFVLLLRYFQKLFLEWHNYRQYNIDNKAYKDARPPVLYLRSFAIDGLGKSTNEYNFTNLKFNLGLGVQKVEVYDLNPEHEMANQVKSIGPLFAIGCNQINHYEQFGATREYYTDANWKDKVIGRMKFSCMIIMVTSAYAGKGVEWELEQIFNRYLAKTILKINRSGILMNKDPLIQGYFNKYNKFVKIASKDIFQDDYVEFDENGNCFISNSLRGTKLFGKLEKLSNENKQNRYCYNCGTANIFNSSSCSKCGQYLDLHIDVETIIQKEKESRKIRNASLINNIIKHKYDDSVILENYLHEGVLTYYDNLDTNGTGKDKYCEGLNEQQIIQGEDLFVLDNKGKINSFLKNVILKTLKPKNNGADTKESSAVYEKINKECQNYYSKNKILSQLSLSEAKEAHGKFLYSLVIEIKEKVDIEKESSELKKQYFAIVNDLISISREALTIAEKILITDEIAYLPFVARKQYNLGIAYCTINEIDKSIFHFKNAYQSLKILSKTQPLHYLKRAVIVLNFIGEYQQRQALITDAEKSFLKLREDLLCLFGMGNSEFKSKVIENNCRLSLLFKNNCKDREKSLFYALECGRLIDKYTDRECDFFAIQKVIRSIIDYWYKQDNTYYLR